MTTMPLLLLALAAAGAAPPAGVPRYRYDPAHTQVWFVADHMGFSRPMGRFTKVEGWLAFDPEDWSRAGCDVTIPVDSLWLGDAAWEKKMLSDRFFDARRHPSMHFACTRFERTGDDRAKLTGELTLRGVTRPLELEVRVNRVGRHSFSLGYVAGFSATGRLRRSDFGMSQLAAAVGDTVELKLEVEAIRE